MLKWSANKYHLSLHVIKRVARDILKGKSMKKMLKTSIGYKGNLGLDFAVAKLKLFQFKNNKVPTTTDKGMGDVINAVFKGYWRKYGISSWGDLIIFTFGKKQLKEWKELVRKQKFNEAVLELNKFFQKYQRLPKFVDEEVRDIINIIRTGFWTKYGIENWNDMLSYVFNNVNFDSRKYVANDGFEKAVSELRVYYEKEGKLPVYDDFNGITGAIRKGYWKNFGIDTWNDILLLVFGEVNFTNNKYKNDKGLEYAVKILKEFEKNNGRRPTNKDKGMSGIIQAIYRGEWIGQDIKAWKDLIKIVFGEVKSRWEKYLGEEGLKNAISEMRVFKEKNKRIPKNSDKGMSGMKGAVYRGEWQCFGLNNWNDLLLHVFANVNDPKLKYKGKRGLEYVAKILKEFEKNNNRLPRTTDKGMNGIKKALYRGEWSVFGIRKWSELITYTFNIE